MTNKPKTRFKREVLLRDPRFSSYQQDFLAVVLKDPDYTIEEAEAAVAAFFHPKEAPKFHS